MHPHLLIYPQTFPPAYDQPLSSWGHLPLQICSSSHKLPLACLLQAAAQTTSPLSDRAL